MKNFFVKKIFVATIAFTTLLSIAAASPLPINVLVSDLEPNVGQDVTVTLKINPDAGTPIFTVSAKLNYDKQKLKFKNAQILDESAIQLGEMPYSLTDTNEGVVLRTSGFPKGLSAQSSFIRYTFTAIKNGQANIDIFGGQALDGNNNDVGMQSKGIVLSVGGVQEVTPTITSDAPKIVASVVKKRSAAFALTGDVVVCKNKDYEFSVDVLPGADMSMQGSYLVSVTDKYLTEIYKGKMEGVAPVNKKFLAKIPANSLAVGSYLLRVKNTKVEQYSDKDLGVVDCGGSTTSTGKIDINSVPGFGIVNELWSIAMCIVLMALLLLYLHDRRHHIKKK